MFLQFSCVMWVFKKNNLHDFYEILLAKPNPAHYHVIQNESHGFICILWTSRFYCEQLIQGSMIMTIYIHDMENKMI